MGLKTDEKSDKSFKPYSFMHVRLMLRVSMLGRKVGLEKIKISSNSKLTERWEKTIQRSLYLLHRW